jgi:hypothetical protein
MPYRTTCAAIRVFWNRKTFCSVSPANTAVRA